MKWAVYENKEIASKITANTIIDVINKKSDANICLPTGSSPHVCFKYMVNAYINKEVDYKNTKFYNMDNYFKIDKMHPASFYFSLYETLYKNIKVPAQNTFTPQTTNIDPIKACLEYDQLFKNNGNMDVIYLGIGEDGHIAYNLPCKKINHDTHIEFLNETLQYNDGEVVFDQAITIGISRILESKKIILNAFGKKKAKIIKQLYDCKVVNPLLPASYLLQHDDVTIILDQEAASMLGGN